MPEGDTIHRAASALRPLLVGEALVALYERGLARRELAGQVFVGVEARGKHLVLTLDGGAVVHVHLGIDGSWRRVPVAALSRGRVLHATLVLATARDGVLFRARTVELLRGAFLHAHPSLRRLGPDLLADAAPPADAGPPADDAHPRAGARHASDADGCPLAADPVLDEAIRRAREPRHAGRAVAELLLDQRVAAGIGNIYKSEALFLERVDPAALVGALDDATLRRLLARARALLSANLGDWPRTTTADVARGERPSPGRGRYWVYRRAGRPCFVCGRAIVAIRQGRTAPRLTFFCPRCQAPLPPQPSPSPSRAASP